MLKTLWLFSGLKYCESLYLGSIVTSWLNPLRVCLPHIATTFASVVRSDCDLVLIFDIS